MMRILLWMLLIESFPSPFHFSWMGWKDYYQTVIYSLHIGTIFHSTRLIFLQPLWWMHKWLTPGRQEAKEIWREILAGRSAWQGHKDLQNISHRIYRCMPDFYWHFSLSWREYQSLTFKVTRRLKCSDRISARGLKARLCLGEWPRQGEIEEKFEWTWNARNIACLTLLY